MSVNQGGEATRRVDAEYLADFLDEHADRLVLYAHQWCESAEDVVQEAFTEFVRQRTLPQNPIAWIYRVVRNRAISTSRSTARRRQHEASFAQQARNWLEAKQENELLASEVSEALAKLPIEFREPIVAHLWGGLTFEQVADLMETSSSSVHRQYRRGLAILKEQLESKCSNPNQVTG